MALIRQGRLAPNEWTLATKAAEISPLGPLYVTPELWAEERDGLLQSGRPLGLWLRSEQSPQDIAEDVRHFGSIALEFPKFTDGRAYSSARILRERLGFKGEIRAVGQVLRDQLLFMQRCGFDAYELAKDQDVEEWLEALQEFSIWYQSAADSRISAARLRRQAQPALQAAE